MEQSGPADSGGPASILALCTALLTAGLEAASEEQVSALEALHPATQREWEVACRVFTGLKRSAWVQIMTKRFLAQEPANVPARVQEAARLAGTPAGREEAVALLTSLSGAKITNPGDLRTLASACHRAGQPKLGVAFLERATVENPEDAEARIVLTHDQINRGDHAAARASLDALMAMRGDTMHGLLAVMALARRMEDRAHGVAALAAAVRIVQPADHLSKAHLLLYAAAIGEWPTVTALLGTIDAAQMSDPQILERMYGAIEGHGFLAEERVLLVRAMALDPADEAIQSAWRRHNAPMNRAFASAKPAPPPGLAARVWRRVRGG